MKNRYKLLYHASRSVAYILYTLYIIVCISIVLRFVALETPTGLVGQWWNTMMQTKLHRVFTMVMRDTAGTLEPGKLLIEILGGASVLFAAVNEVKSSSSLGMMMEDVIGCFFPHHLRIQGVSYFLITLTGQYACTRNMGVAAGLCLLGVLICLIYAGYMARCLVFSTQRRKELTLSYIETEMRRSLKSRDDMLRTKNIAVVILDYARYVGQQWNSKAALQVHREGKLYRNSQTKRKEQRGKLETTESQAKKGPQKNTLEIMLVRLTACGVFQDEKFLNAKYKDTGEVSGRELPVHSSFCEFFSPPPYSAQVERDVLYNKARFFSESTKVKDFREHVRRCCQVWDQLFFEITDEQRRVRIAHAVLSEARDISPRIFTLLSLGLLEYLGIARKDQDLSRLKEKSEFLFEILRTERIMVPEEREDTAQLGDAGTEILYLMAGVFCWLQAWNSTDIGWEQIEDILTRIPMVSPMRIVRLLQKHQMVYAVLAYLLVCFENDEQYKEMTSYVLLELEHSVLKRMSL